MSDSNPYQRQILVCTAGKTCPTQGAADVHRAIKDAVFRSGRGNSVRVNKAGCVAQCGYGPMVVFWPEGRWYAAVRREDVDELLTAELDNGAPLERLLYRPATPGKNVCHAGEVEGTIPPFADHPGA
ncbi:MAG: (2Fe-2S) ferredoxin domain-containing protein [Planctomycetota bacterium]|jgi:(2Fe-2S) ferredoxin